MKDTSKEKLYDSIAKGKETDGNKVVASLYEEVAIEKDGNKLVEGLYNE
jgi:hypothetical protein